MGDDSDSDGEQDIELIAPELAGLIGDKQPERAQKTDGIPKLDLIKIRSKVINGGKNI